MNAKTLPLAALLMTAALAARAQLLNPPAGGTGFNLSNSGLSGLGSSSGSDPLNDDMTYKCSTVPFRQCTADELNRQENVKRAGRCPMSPASDACASFLMRSSSNGGANPAQTIAAYTPPPGQRWASPDCQRIPCRLEPDPDAATTVDEIVVTGRRPAPTEASSQYGVEGGLVGPPCPPEICGGGNNSAQWDSQFEAIKDKNPGAVNVGNERYIVPDPEDPSKWHECTVMMCKREPVDGSKYADQIQAAKANAAMFNVNSASRNGGNKTSSPPPPPQDPVDPNPQPVGNPTSDASDVITAMRSMGRGGDGETTTGSSWTGQGTGGTGGQGGEPGASPVVKIAGSDISHPDDIPVTFVANQKMAGVIQAAHAGVDSGADESLVTTGGQTSAELRGRIAEPPVDQRYLGKIQAVANDKK